MKNCIFCNVAHGKQERDYKIFEDKKHIAFLDVYPITRGQCLVIPKKHIEGLNAFNLSDKDFSKLFLFTKKLTKKLRKN